MEANTLNLAEQFAVSNAATESLLLPMVDTSELHGWSGPGRELKVSYVIEDDFGIQTATTSVFAITSATARRDELQRRIVFDAAGLIEQFSASNVSAVLAQSTNVLNLSRAVFLKCSADLAVRRDDTIPMYVVSDPFPPLYQKLTELGHADVRDSWDIPTAVALSNARQVLDATRQERMLPSKILRGSNGVFVYFSNEPQYAEIECDNDGDIGIVMSDRSGNPTLWFSESNRLRSDLARIRAFLI